MESTKLARAALLALYAAMVGSGTRLAKLFTMASTGRSLWLRRCAVRLRAGKNAVVTATAPKKFCKILHAVREYK